MKLIVCHNGVMVGFDDVIIALTLTKGYCSYVSLYLCRFSTKLHQIVLFQELISLCSDISFDCNCYSSSAA